MAFQDNTILLTTAPQILISPSAGQEIAIFGFTFWNSSGAAVPVTVRRYVQATGTTIAIATVMVPVGGNYPWPNRLSLAAGDQLIAYAALGAAVTVDLNWYLATGSAPIATGLTPRGAWNSAANYNANDVVSNSGANYIALSANTNSAPPSSNWMSLANNSAYAAGTGIVINAGTISTDPNAVFSQAVTAALIFRR